jgi:hypothetical protein
MKPLTALQRLVLLAACDVDYVPHTGIIPTGVFHSLIDRGLMQPYRGGYALTAAGVLAVETLEHTQ